MRIVFMGTPDFAVPCLKALYENGHDITLVVTQPDKPQGRKQILTPSPVKEFAKAHEIPVYQPVSMKTQESYDRIVAEHPDYIVVIAFGKILPQAILDIPKYACINVHGSLLPRYRGAAPIQWSVLNGDAVTGVTTMLMDAGIDTGDILLQQETPIDPCETAGELFDRLAELSAPVLVETLDLFAKGEIKPTKQDNEKADYVTILKKENALIDWARDAKSLHNHVRGMNPWPVAFTKLGGKTLKIFETRESARIFGHDIGEVTAQDGKLFVRCGADTCLQILSLQLEGAKRLDADVFLRGRAFTEKTILGIE
ncbi:MAG: methionyl-tRNA formyltransferase [Ruminococcaceae bacterium]|nr:methionyl-tRNA formyltransferase [Oscillospiraceae bacterium]